MKLPKLPTFVDGKDDLDAYLDRFERYAQMAKWQKDEWSMGLGSLLTGEALEVYSRASRVDAKDYDALKKALLDRYQTRCRRVQEEAAREFSNRRGKTRTVLRPIERISVQMD